MAKQNYTVRSKGDYQAFKKKHQTVSNGTIYENNIVTLSNFDELFTTEAETYSDFGFRFNVKGTGGLQKRHVRGGWADSAETLCSSEVINGSKFGENNGSILDFAYYGSALKLFQASINHIVTTFPGELYFTGKEAITISGDTYYYIDNPFNIQLDSDTKLIEDIEDPLKYFNVSLDSYSVVSGGTYLDIVPGSLNVIKLKPKCGEKDSNLFIESLITFKVSMGETEKEISIIGIYISGNKSYIYKEAALTYGSIRPKASILDVYYNNISDFEKLLINPATRPIYTCNFRKYTENQGVETYSMVHYTWPSVNNYNPIINGAPFEDYVSSIIDLCVYYDEHLTDNMWRNITHEAIKGLDWTYIDNGDEARIDSSKVEALEHIYGRLFDDLKHAIDTMKKKNSIGNKTNEKVLESLSSEIEKKGLECISLNLCDNCDEYSPILYKSMSEGYTCADANIAFLRNILRNANYLNSIKGTRFGVETMLKLFGLTDDEIEINEYTYVAKANDDLGSFNTAISGISYPNAESIEEINTNSDLRISRSLIDDKLEGIPVNYMTVINNGSVVRYAIPWYSQDKKYDSGLYFQMNGGWMRRFKKDINLIIAPNIHEIESDGITKLYSDSKNIIQFGGRITDILLLGNNSIGNDIIYIYNIGGMNDSYSFGPSEAQSGFTHYFILENAEKANVLGFDYDSNTYGWRNVNEMEFASASTLTSAARRVLYYESLYELSNGNNPHCGNGKYDDGNEYVQYMAEPLKWLIDNNLLHRYTDAEILEIAKIKYNMTNYVDNRKCWFFANGRQMNEFLLESENGGDYQENRIPDICISGSSNFAESVSGSNATCLTAPINPEGGDYNDASAANSIVNVKNLVIKINLRDKTYLSEFGKFYDKIMSRYVAYMVPSTSICTVIIDGLDEEKFNVKFYDYVNPVGGNPNIKTYNNVPFGSGVEDPYNG